MSLAEINLSLEDVGELPADLADFLAESDRRINRYVASTLDRPVHAFVPSDFALVYSYLRALADSNLAPGKFFCEWGSGFGVVTCLASAVGFSACGIEIERELVEGSRALAAEFFPNVEFACGSFIPPGGEAMVDDVDEYAWLVDRGANGYEELLLEPDDFDVIFAFPWPGEEHVIEALFEYYAGVGAVLITFRGKEGVRIQRKLRARSTTRF